MTFNQIVELCRLSHWYQLSHTEKKKEIETIFNPKLQVNFTIDYKETAK